ncbi:heme protein [Candidatus Brocadia pituitae]|nr:heme protein [Candidatus Brocadia pituitae]
MYTGSDHDLAMDFATDTTVLGDFNHASFNHLGVISRFYKRDGKFFVFTEGFKGKFQEFTIIYTFGVRPLQQYLVEFPDGRVQTLPLCWDTRPKEQGGQRWFHIYGNERIPPDDILYWTRISQNWNYMCAECHSTNLKKNYDAVSDRYNTTWSEIDVSCEACHGPGSLHVEWAEADANGEDTQGYADMGISIRLKGEEDEEVTWVFDKKLATYKPGNPQRKQKQVEMCARCHTRRGVISEGYVHGKPLLDTHYPQVLEENLYYPDGQIRDEVYEYGSFLQSKMYRSGIVCTDCHDPHTTRRRKEGNELCYSCHQTEKYGSRKHHFHKIDSPGSQCIECHMTARTYMVVDPRRDHSFRVPRPDLSKKLGVPNGCNNCHADKSTAWAAEHFEKWYGHPKKGKHYGEIFWAARQGIPGTDVELIRLAGDQQQSPMVRATAITLLRNYPCESTILTLKKLLQDGNPLIRSEAVTSLDILPPNDRVPFLLPVLQDPVRLVRTLAARSLAVVSTEFLPKDALQRRNTVVNEYEETQLLNADYPAAHINLGNLYLERSEYDRAAASYKKAIEIEPTFVPGYINLADVYRVQNQDEKGREILHQTLNIAPGSAPAHHAMGLLMIRTGGQKDALHHLRKAAILAPEHAQYSYVYGIALNSLKMSGQAVSVLKRALNHNPYDCDLMVTLATIHRDRGEFEKALRYTARLIRNYPDNNNYQQLEEQVRVLAARQGD